MKKTNTLTKLLALVLSLVMMCSMSVSAFAAEVADVEYAPDIENCEVITIDLNEALAKAEEFNLNARSIFLEHSTYKMYNIGTLSADQSVKITVTWKPVTSPIHIGLVKSSSSTGNLLSLTGGNRSFTATVNSAGTYYLMIANPSSSVDLNIEYLGYSK